MTATITQGESGWEVKGHIVMDTANELLMQSKQLKLTGNDIVDFKQVTELDTAAVSLMLEWERRAIAEHKQLTFVNLPGYFGRGKENDAWVDEIIESLGLTDKAHTNMRRLSGGMKRRALIAQALAHKPPVIVLDEPTAGVDVELRQLMWAFIRRLNKEGHTIILTTHYLEEAEELCSRVAMMKQGEIVALDTTANLLNKFAAKNLRITLLSGHLPPSLQKIMKSSEGLTFTLALTDVNQVEFVLSELRKANVVVDDMQITEADLEDVFLSLVGGA
ncbi:putative ABC transporter ATP-binding protein YadG [Nymphon striatum]|nr:putative ABC transporter ATP-binding protein YadG [Nymphon striatum]